MAGKFGKTWGNLPECSVGDEKSREARVVRKQNIF